MSQSRSRALRDSIDIRPLIALSAYTIQFIDLLKQQLMHRKQLSQSTVRVKLSNRLTSRLDSANDPRPDEVQPNTATEGKRDMHAGFLETDEHGLHNGNALQVNKAPNPADQLNNGAIICPVEGRNETTGRKRGVSKVGNDVNRRQKIEDAKARKQREAEQQEKTERYLAGLMDEVRHEITREIKESIEKEVRHLIEQTKLFTGHVKTFIEGYSMSTGHMHALFHLNETSFTNESIPRTLTLLHLARECVYIAISPVLMLTDINGKPTPGPSYHFNYQAIYDEEERHIRQSFLMSFGFPLRAHQSEHGSILLRRLFVYGEQLDRQILGFVRQSLHQVLLPCSSSTSSEIAQNEKVYLDAWCPKQFREHLKDKAIEPITAIFKEELVPIRAREDIQILTFINQTSPELCEESLDVVNILMDRSEYADEDVAPPDEINVHNAVRYNATQLQNKEIEDEILRILDFRMRDVRRNSVQDAHSETFHWLLDEPPDVDLPWDSLVHWLRSGTGCYWIGSKPGSGKSTLLKFLLSSPTFTKHLRYWAQCDSIIIASHFLWKVGTEMQKNQEGLLRSLLASILRARRDFIPIAFPDMYQELKIRDERSQTVSRMTKEKADLAEAAQIPFSDMLSQLKHKAELTRRKPRNTPREKVYGQTKISEYATAHLGDRYENYSIQNMHFHMDPVSQEPSEKVTYASESFTVPLLDELKLALLRVCGKIKKSAKICLIIDGFDEFEGDSATDQKSMVDFILKITQQSENVKAIVSSRLEPLFESSFINCPKLRLHDFTRNDMLLYINEELSASPQFAVLKSVNPEGIKDLCTETATLASGVFLWIKLVVRDLRKGLDAGDNLEELSMALHGLPSELKDLFTHMLERQAQGMTSVKAAAIKQQASKIFQWMFTCFKTEGKLPLALRLWYLDTHEDSSIILRWSLAELKAAGTGEAAAERAKLIMLEKRLLSRCCGLLELEKNEFSPGHWRIALLHRTVLDFWEQSECKKRITEFTKDIRFSPVEDLMASVVFTLSTKFMVTPDHWARGDKTLADTVHDYLSVFSEYAEIARQVSPSTAEKYIALLDGVLDWRHTNFREWRGTTTNLGRPYRGWINHGSDSCNEVDTSNTTESSSMNCESSNLQSSTSAVTPTSGLHRKPRRPHLSQVQNKDFNINPFKVDPGKTSGSNDATCSRCNTVKHLREMGFSYDRIYQGLENAKVGNDVAGISAWLAHTPEVSDIVLASTPWSKVGIADVSPSRKPTEKKQTSQKSASVTRESSQNIHNWTTVSYSAPQQQPKAVVGLAPLNATQHKRNVTRQHKTANPPVSGTISPLHEHESRSEALPGPHAAIESPQRTASLLYPSSVATVETKGSPMDEQRLQRIKSMAASHLKDIMVDPKCQEYENLLQEVTQQLVDANADLPSKKIGKRREKPTAFDWS